MVLDRGVRMKPLNLKEIALKEEMKERCLTKGQYIDENAKKKFDMLCHLEDFEIKYWELQEENKRLNGAIQTYDILLKANVEENKKLKDNWNKLKEYCKENTLCYEVGDDENTKLIGSRIHGLNVLDKMQEMEKNYGNVEDNT